MDTERVPLASLVADPRNARVHSDRNIAAIRESVERFGQRRPLVARRGSRVVLAGNGLMRAMLDLGMSEASVLWVDDDDAAAAAYAIADNRSGELAAWDAAVLVDLASTADTLIGFTPEEIAAFDIGPAGGAADPAFEPDGARPGAEPRPQPVALLMLPDGADVLLRAIDKAITGGRSTLEAVKHIAEVYLGQG